MLWGSFAKLFGEQITTLKTLQDCYLNKRYSVLYEQLKEQSNIAEPTNKIFTNGTFEAKVNRLAESIHEKIGVLTGTSQTLIQLVGLSTLRLPL